MSLILNQSQAEAIYSAMCALNNVGLRLTAQVHKTGKRPQSIVVQEHATGCITVYVAQNDEPVCGRYQELHNSQHDFVAAYGLL